MTGEPAAVHAVSVYDSAAELADEVMTFAADGLEQGERVLLVATARHLDPVTSRLAQRGTRASSLGPDDLVLVDADELLSRFVVDGAPDPEGFLEHVGGLVAEHSADGRPLRIFGEMVAVMWERGAVAGALEVERLWNALQDARPFPLLCAYNAGSWEQAPVAHATAACRLHSQVVTPRSYANPELPSVPETSTARVFVPVPLAVPAARRFASQVLRTWGHDALLEDAEVVVSELATNAFAHARSAFRLALARLDGHVRISVEDAEAEEPRRRLATPHSTGGRGMPLVEALAGRWGWEVGPDGKQVWAELPVAG